MTNPAFISLANLAWERYKTAVQDEKQSQEEAFKEILIASIELQEERFIELYCKRTVN